MILWLFQSNIQISTISIMLRLITISCVKQWAVRLTLRLSRENKIQLFLCKSPDSTRICLGTFLKHSALALALLADASQSTLNHCYPSTGSVWFIYIGQICAYNIAFSIFAVWVPVFVPGPKSLQPVHMMGCQILSNLSDFLPCCS